MGKIRVRTLGDEDLEQKQIEKSKARREGKKGRSQSEALAKDGKAHVKGVGLKGGQQVKVMEGDTLKPEIEAMLREDAAREAGQDTASSLKQPKKPKKLKIRVRSKRYQALTGMVDKNKLYNLTDAIALVKKTSTTKFDATVESHININPATLPPDKQTVNGSVNLPHGTGKKRVISIADEDLIKKVAEGKIEFDVLVAHPSMMPKLAKVAKILGPKGLMPNPKTHTVTPEPEKRVKELSGGEINFKSEPNNPIVHQAIGKVSFKEAQLAENLKTMVKAVGQSKIAKLTLSSTMGPGIRVDLGTI
jgi:large subunit ribosomal protein L1